MLSSQDGIEWTRVSSSWQADLCGSRNNHADKGLVDLDTTLSTMRMELSVRRGEMVSFHFDSLDCVFPIHLVYWADFVTGLVWSVGVVLSVYYTAMGKWSWVTDLGRKNSNALFGGLRFPVQFVAGALITISCFKIAGVILAAQQGRSHIFPYGPYLIYQPAAIFGESMSAILIFPGPDLFTEAFFLERLVLLGFILILRTLGSGGVWAGAFIFLMGVCLVVFREVRRHQRCAIVASDLQVWRDAWNRLLSQEPDFEQSLAQLRHFESEVNSVDPEELRLNVLRALLQDMANDQHSEIAQYIQEEMAAALTHDVGVTSLDQVYAQAVAIEPLFRSKVEWIAGKCNAHFRVGPIVEDVASSNGEAGLEIRSWSDIQRDPVALAGVRWAGLKHVNRAVYNLAIFYDGNLSKLTDIVRQRMVFRSLADVHACLTCIAQDPELQIVSIQNGFDPNYDASPTAGYRDLVVNLQIVSKVCDKYTCLHIPINR